MAGLKRCLGVDLGGFSVKIAEMAIDKGGVRVVRMVSAPLPIGPDALESERSSVLIATVRGLVKTHKISTKHAVFSMPGQTIFQRRLRLPRAPGPRLNQIINFEARQVIPFPLEKTTLRYQVFDTEDEREVEVLLVAMKKETNETFMRMVRRMGLRPAGIGITTLALFNGQELHRFNLAQWLETKGGSGGFMGLSLGKGASKGKKKSPASKQDKKAEKKRKKEEAKKKKGEKAPEEVKEAMVTEAAAALDVAEGEDEYGEDLGMDHEFEEVRAFVDLGAFSTDLAVCKSGGAKIVGFTRSVPIGGNHISKAIQKECNCESFAQAEEIKCERTGVLSGLFEFEADKEAFDEQACQAATTVCDRIIAEIRRSLDYYISQSDGTSVDQVVLSGAGAQMPFLAGYVEERLGIPAEVDSTLGHDQIKSPSQYAENFDFSPFKVALGLASQGLGISPLEIDFLPDEIQTMRDFSSQYLEIVVLAGMIGGMIFFGSNVGSSKRRALSEQVEKLKSQIADLKPQEFAYNEAVTQRATISQKLSLIQKSLFPNGGIPEGQTVQDGNSRDFWLRFQSHLHDIKPPEVLITKYECFVDPNYPHEAVVRIEGEAEDQNSNAEFGTQLQNEALLSKDQPGLYIKKYEGIEFSERESEYFKRAVAFFNITLTVQDKHGRLITNILDINEFNRRKLIGELPAGGEYMDDEYGYFDEEIGEYIYYDDEY